MLKNIVITIGIILFDQVSKILILKNLFWNETRSVIDLKFFGINLFLTHNTGAAFGFLHNAGGWQNSLFLTITIAAGVIILYLLITNKVANSLEKLALLFILGGGIGNLIDRLLYGYVIDFIDVYLKDYHWYTFNIADSAICIAMGLLIFNLVLSSYQPLTRDT